MSPSVHEPETLPSKEITDVPPWHVRRIDGVVAALSSDAAVGRSETESALGISSIPMIVLEMFKPIYPGLPGKAVP